MQITDTIIIGGGIAGLYAALRLQQQNIPYVLLEAKPKLGGRIFSQPLVADSSLSVDLGPTWFWPHQLGVQQLLGKLKLAWFEQYTTGDVLYQLEPDQSPQRTRGAGSMLSYRVEGGMQKLIDALAGELDAKQIKTGHRVNCVERIAGEWQVHANYDDTLQLFQASRLLFALPPRLIVKYLNPETWLSQHMIDDFCRQQTWMSAQAKFVAVYETPFWRESGLAGQALSRVGPLVEIHDASASAEGGFALFGFIGLPVASRKQLSHEQLISKCQQQLGAIFGSEALNPQNSYLVDWSLDKWVATEQDGAESPQHPDFNLYQYQQELSVLNAHLIASEFADSEAGYIEGALIAVDNSMLEIFQRDKKLVHK